MNNKRLISLTICWILVVIPGICVLSFAGNESAVNTEAQKHFEKANELRKVEDYDTAIAEYNKVLNLSPNSKIARNAQYWIGQSHFGAGQFDAALSAFQKLIDEYPASTIIPSTKLMIQRVQQAKNNKSLLEAATKGDTEQVKALIATGADVNAKDEEGGTSLHRAAQFGHSDVAKFLIAKGADVNAKGNEYGLTPLHVAAATGQAAVVELLLAEDVDINAHARYGHTSLEYAAWYDHLDVVELLISKGADIEAGDNWGTTPLGVAVSSNRPEAVKLLLKRGAYIEGRDHYDATPLHRAISKGNQDMVELLLAKGAAPWRRRMGLGLVGIAMKENEKEMIKFLIEKGVQHSAVHVAAFFGNMDEVKSYLAKGGDINAQDPSQLTLLACAICGGQATAAEFLISKGADINLKGACGRPALHTAIWTPWNMSRGHPEIARMLLEKGADVTIRDDFGGTALLWTAFAGHKDIIETMLTKGADVNAKSGVFVAPGGISDKGWTPLHGASVRARRAAVEVLIANGADVNAKTKNGRTPMSLAKGNEHTGIVELLRKHGAKE